MIGDRGNLDQKLILVSRLEIEDRATAMPRFPLSDGSVDLIQPDPTQPKLLIRRCYFLENTQYFDRCTGLIAGWIAFFIRPLNNRTGNPKNINRFQFSLRVTKRTDKS